MDKEFVGIASGSLEVPPAAVRRMPGGAVGAVVKRSEDLVIALALLLPLLLVLAVIALAIRLETPGPVLFRQPRRGRDGAIFGVLKFRTMYARQMDREGRLQGSRHDPRITRVGGFLRRHSLDELPQFLNVLRGDMSIVGPRPHPLGMTVDNQHPRDIIDTYMERYQVRPGITGWAQINGWRGPLDTVEQVKKRVEHDLYYIDNWSLSLDIWIILRSVTCVFYDPRAF